MIFCKEINVHNNNKQKTYSRKKIKQKQHHIIGETSNYTSYGNITRNFKKKKPLMKTTCFRVLWIPRTMYEKRA